MPDVVTIGPLFLNGKWLTVFIGFAFAAWVLQWSLKKKSEPYKSAIEDVFFTGVLVAVLTWKLSPILFQPSLIKKPIMILLMPGGLSGIILGLLAAAGYGYYICKKHVIPLRKLLDELSIPAVLFFLVYFVLSPVYGKETETIWGVSLENGMAYHPIHVYRAVGVALLLFVLWFWRAYWGMEGRRASVSLAGIGLTLWFGNFWARNTDVFWGIPSLQWLGILSILLGLLLWPGKRNFKSSGMFESK